MFYYNGKNTAFFAFNIILSFISKEYFNWIWISN